MTEPRARLAYRESQRVAVTIQIHADELLRVPRRRPLDPQRLARAGPIDPASLSDGAGQGLARAPHETERSTRFVADHSRPHVARQRFRERRGDGLAKRELAGIQRHADLRIGADAIQLRNVRSGGDPAGGGDARPHRRTNDRLDRGEVEPSHLSFLLHLCEEETTDNWRELAHTLEDADAGLRAPTVHDDLAALGVHRGDHALARQGATEFRRRALPKSRMPPPTRHGARRTRSRISAAFEPPPRPSAASRSTTATSPAMENSSSRSTGSPPSRTNSLPRRSCTARPPMMSMLGTIIAAPEFPGPPGPL